MQNCQFGPRIMYLEYFCKIFPEEKVFSIYTKIDGKISFNFLFSFLVNSMRLTIQIHIPNILYLSLIEK